MVGIYIANSLTLTSFAQMCVFVFYLWIWELLIAFQDVKLLLLLASFSNTFLRNCGGGEGLRPTSCAKTVVRGK